ncbi:hypothetical protein [Vulcanococcus limneticus]|uniref:hypothetical protein n=1 Tax=Vulcanococcus limneticus TaxID=2170428 RepID=UPI00398C120B
MAAAHLLLFRRDRPRLRQKLLNRLLDAEVDGFDGARLWQAIAELVPRRFVRDLLPQLQALRDALPAELKPRR